MVIWLLLFQYCFYKFYIAYAYSNRINHTVTVKAFEKQFFFAIAMHGTIWRSTEANESQVSYQNMNSILFLFICCV